MAHLSRSARSVRVGGVFAVLAAIAGFVSSEARATTQSTGSMAGPRSEHTATFLGTGKVLVAGGTDSTGRLATAELYDPATGSFTTTAAMPEARHGHTATMLPTGKVLVAGGNGDAGALATCRLYDPRTEAWTTTGSMTTARREHTATLLANGKVLVAGGQNGTAPSYAALSSAELYDPATGTWTATGALGSARAGHAAALLADGKVLVAGGQTRWIPLPALYTSTAYLYDPATGTWSPTGSMTAARRSFTLTLIPGGLVVAAGGRNASYLSSAERYNVSTGTWGSAGSLGAARSGHAAALLPDARVLLVGGSDGTGPAGAMLEYTPGTNGWAVVETGGARYDHTATLLPGGRVLVVGGEETGWLSDAEIVDRMNPAWTTVGTTWGRADGTATLLPNGKVLLLGKVASGDATRGALLDPETGTFTATADTMVAPRSKHTATLLADGDVLIVGGVDGTGALVAQDEIYDPDTDTFTALAVPLPTRRAEHAAALLPDGRVLVAGGQSPSTLAPYIYSGGVWTVVNEEHGYDGWGVRLMVLANGHVLVKSGNLLLQFDPFPGALNTRWRTLDISSGNAVGEPVLLPSGDVLFVQGYPVPRYTLWDVESSSFQQPFPAIPPGLPLRFGFRALALPDGRVLVTGGYGGDSGVEPLAHAAVLDPATGVTTPLPSMTAERSYHAMTLLPNGRVLVAGGVVGNTTTIEPTVETLRLWPGLADSSRPVITSWPATLSLPGSFVLNGTGFLGIGEASGGNGATSSSVGFPAVLLRRIEGGFSRWVPSYADGAFGATAFTSSEVSGIPGGHYLATLYASGIPSKPKVVVVSPCEIYVGVMGSTADASVCVGDELRLEARVLANTSNVTYTWKLPDGSTYGPSSDLVIPDAQVEDGGFYTVVASREGCVGPVDTVEVRVAPPGQMPIITAPFVLLHSQEGEASVEWQLGSSWTWTLSGGTILRGQGTNRIRFRAANDGNSMTITVVETVGESCDQPPSMAVVELELPATKFYPVTPCRLLDTRNADGPDAAAPALAPGETRVLQVGTRCGLNASAVRALAVNQTVTQPTADGELVLYRGDLSSTPVTSNVSFRAGKTRANNGILELNRFGDGAFRVHNRSAGTVHFILDVSGTFK